MSKKIMSSIKYFIVVILVIIFPIIIISPAGAEQISGRSITLSSSESNASDITYTLLTDALPTSTTPVKSMEIKFCTSISESCTTPSGFSSSLSTLASQPSGLGATSGWTVNTSTTGSLRIVNVSNSTNPSGPVSVIWSGVHNPQIANQTFYGIVSTYSDSAWTTAIDTGSVALSTSSQIQVALSVKETLTFCTGTSITNQNCGTISGDQVNLGTGSTTATATGTSVFAVGTNGVTGYSVMVTGNTLRSGGNSITAMSSGGASTVNSSQFGINLADNNTTPAVGATKTGSGTGTATLNYGTDDNFRFVSGDTVASASGSTSSNTFTVSYIANIDASTPPGAYNTSLKYTATANF
ncbi:MAG TPA: hypothetical protein PLO25_01450 [Candidatus Saccharibacteria bacterium]|nr:hypothetical protein [Candidatus Saccharibacteria bacterium]